MEKIYRHVAYNVTTAEVCESTSGTRLKRLVAAISEKGDKWRFCHDGGARWAKEGPPKR